jgi:hypothetical protein
MPFVYDETEIEWPEDDDDFEPPPPRTDQFVYLTPPEFGGAPEPVRFSVTEPQQAAEPAPPAPGGPPLSAEEVRRQREKEWEERKQRGFALGFHALRKAGVQRLYCRYDGGNDEGFSWLGHAEMADGARLDAETLSQRLYDAGLLNKLYATGIMHGSASRHFSELHQLRVHFLDYWLVNEWATMLLGYSFGTGEYSMYGAFTVDLEACTITDDRNADPVVHNIEIAT